MKRSVFAVSMAMLCLGGTAFGQIYSKNYYFGNTIPNYNDVTTVKATEQVNATENITVGFARESSTTFSNDIVVAKTNHITGDVIWVKRYGVAGVDERAFGVDLTYNGQDVIVVGSAQEQNGSTRRNAFAMRLQVLTGNVVWSNEYGAIGTDEDFKMIEKSFGNTSIQPIVPTYFIVGSSNTNTQKSILYTAAIDENGNSQYLKTYQEVFASNVVFDVAFTMVKNKKGNFIVAGTRYENTQPSRIFTVGFSPTTGLVSDKYLFYGAEVGRLVGGSIERLTFTRSAKEAFALTFTSASPDVEPGVTTAISVLLLNEDREPKWLNYYWRPEHRSNQGYSIYQNPLEENWLNIYANTFKSRNNPGFLSVDMNTGNVNYFIEYNITDNTDSKFATAMVEANPSFGGFGYIAKALHRDGDNGFTLAGLDEFGRTICADITPVKKEEQKPGVAKRTYQDANYGTQLLRKVDKISISGKTDNCDGTGSSSFRLATAATDAVDGVDLNEATGTYNVYPNPISQNGDQLKLAYTIADEKAVEISVFNALGQQTALRNYSLSAGEQVLELENELLSPGLNLITVRSEGEILYQARVVMH
ncbi:MAG: T9SS type A sorting domain-containing protein [Salibacteraceae bacterium]